MAQAEVPTAASVRLDDLASRLEAKTGFANVIAALNNAQAATLDGVWGSSCALVAATLARHTRGLLLVVTAQPADVDSLCDDLPLFTPARIERFPAWDAPPEEATVDDEVFGDRLRLLKSLLPSSLQPPASSLQPPASGLTHSIVVTSIQALLQPVPAPELLARRTRLIARLDEMGPEALRAWLVEQGFHASGAVELPGEFSLRGGILDLFAPDWDHPVRIEFFGDQIESIRRFEVQTQRSLELLESVEVTVLNPNDRHAGHFSSFLPEGTWSVLVEPWQLEEEGRRWLKSLDRPDEAHTVRETLEQLFRFPSVTASRIATASLETTCRLKIESVERFSGDISKVKNELDQVGEGQQVFVVCQSEAEAKRLAEVFGETRLAAEGRLHLPIGRLHAGFRLVSDRIVLVSGSELFHRTDLSRPSRRRLGRVIDSFLELREGDLVVHVAHGIGRYRGLKLLMDDDQGQEHLEIEFHEGTKVYVPASKIELVQKYVGGARAKPNLARLGGRSWVKQKEAAQRAVTDLASDMLNLQAARQIRTGIAFPPDSDWQREFDASFAYVETPDQLAGIVAIRRDMCDPKPMDRLICGDVGYGKTELAMRAAFKAVDSGYQVAILVPTTILAEQHGRTFRSRMSEFPFEIAVLSRFCTTSQQKRIVAALADGSIDVVIGTHRLAQTDIRFNNLGLVVIDEEQRFGVDVKERLKAYRHSVDVLTMTATPIPRTLHMSLLGLRDITNLETPPADRLAIETRVARFDPELIRHAVERELGRGGQIFFVHNRVHDIQHVAWQLNQIVPGAKIGIGHGQMPEGELEEVMLAFVDHRFDILLATTIVESGLDIPNANTMFIDDADQYGLADLHQLRGRVGRYKHRAYCYLLLHPDRPLTPAGARRMAAIEEFSDMGAGFAIAMRDLEIRGAGNILGTEQSGHIAVVGYEMYCEMLEKTVRQLKRLPPKSSIDVHLDLPGEAYFPRRFVADMRQKIDLYRRLARVSTHDELADFRAELLDRFGKGDAMVERLLDRMELRILAHSWGIHSIHLEDAFAVFGYQDRRKTETLAQLRRGRLRIVDAKSCYVPLGKELADGDRLLLELKALLQPA